MRTTIDIPDGVYARLCALARVRGVTPGALLVELAEQGLTSTPTPGGLRRDARTGLLTVAIGIPMTHEEAGAILDLDA